MDSSNILVPSRTYVYLALLGTAAPADHAAALGAGWKNVGHTTPDSLSFNTEPEFEEVQSAQSDYPVRRFKASESATVSVDLLEFSAANFKSVYGGGTVTEIGTAGSGKFKFVPPSSIGVLTEVSAIIEVKDGVKVYRYIYPKVVQIEGVETELQKGSQSMLPLRLAVLGADGTDPWYVLTNDDSFDETP